MYSRFTKIKNLSDRRRLPLLGKIRLGIKVFSEKAQKEYPKETDYFVVPEEVAKIYTEEPKELDVLFPMEDEGTIFSQSYRCYGRTKGLKCEGNGEVAVEFTEEGMKDRECPCQKLEKKECCQRGFLRVVLPKVSMGGVYQIVTSSYNSIIDINSGIDYVRALIGRIVFVPLKLRRVPIETHHDQKKQTHYTMKLIFDGTADFINQLRDNTKKMLLKQEKVALPAPQEESIAGDEPVDIIEHNGITDEEKENKPQNALQNAQDTPSTPVSPENKPKKPQIERLPEGVHPKVISDGIKDLLRKSGYLAKKNAEGKNYELVLIQHINKKAKKYSDLNREELESLYYQLTEAKGNPDVIAIPFE